MFEDNKVNRMGEAQQSTIPTTIQKVHFGSLANEEVVHKLQVLKFCVLSNKNHGIVFLNRDG